ncbi:hypothetical protein Pan54_13740 [Rubinisphaera italica]|uniref:Uncharacterized protein n=1 Tax=Rubinisphaera italica TaxID=2527969 RepID=A0A5C5XCB7_9PLAN|nr:hypothetical protein Pan54_13740 [Rubinisphaera italica]
MIPQLLGNHTHSYLQEDQHTLTQYRSTCTITDHLGSKSKTDSLMTSDD